MLRTITHPRRLALLLCCLTMSAAAAAPPELWREAEIIRTEHGVPHVRAANLRAAGYAMGWLQCEDYGDATPSRLWMTSGRTALVNGKGALAADFQALRRRELARRTFHLLEPETRDFYEGFAAGVNRYLEIHRSEFPAHREPAFTELDVAALNVGPDPIGPGTRQFAGRPSDPGAAPMAEPPNPGADPEEGSNAWALAPSRTKSGKAILLRNPHLAWNAGYYEAHVTVPGVIDFYGDFRIGGPFGVVGGFNRHLGWSTTNSNAGDLTEFYALPLDPARPDHYRLDGESLPLTRVTLSAGYRDGTGQATATRDFWETAFGPVVHRTAGTAIVARTAGAGEFRAGEQFLRMMRASSLQQWLEAMRLRARTTQNFTYADRAGNILLLWNASLPHLSHPPGRGAPVPVTSRSQIWSQLIPFEDLPLTLNPGVGYVQNANNSPHFPHTGGTPVLTNKYPNMERPSLSLRAQLSLELVGGDSRLSLEDVIRLKHSTRMLLADRVKPDLVAAVAANRPDAEVARALELLRRWDNTTDPASRGAVLFSVWWNRYSRGNRPPQIYATPWSESEPFATPQGLADPARAAATFAEAVAETAKLHGSWDVAWGDVHRVRRGEVDVPVGGGPGALGSFRTLNFSPAKDGKLVVNGGDGWVLAVEFGDEPRAFSVLAYGESSKPDSPWHADQAAMFARGELKPVRFLAADVDRHAVKRYRPGAP